MGLYLLILAFSTISTSAFTTVFEPGHPVQNDVIGRRPLNRVWIVPNMQTMPNIPTVHQVIPTVRQVIPAVPQITTTTIDHYNQPDWLTNIAANVAQMINDNAYLQPESRRKPEKSRSRKNNDVKESREANKSDGEREVNRSAEAENESEDKSGLEEEDRMSKKPSKATKDTPRRNSLPEVERKSDKISSKEATSTEAPKVEETTQKENDDGGDDEETGSPDPEVNPGDGPVEILPEADDDNNAEVLPEATSQEEGAREFEVLPEIDKESSRKKRDLQIQVSIDSKSSENRNANGTKKPSEDEMKLEFLNEELRKSVKEDIVQNPAELVHDSKEELYRSLPIEPLDTTVVEDSSKANENATTSEETATELAMGATGIPDERIATTYLAESSSVKPTSPSLNHDLIRPRRHVDYQDAKSSNAYPYNPQVIDLNLAPVYPAATGDQISVVYPAHPVQNQVSGSMFTRQAPFSPQNDVSRSAYQSPPSYTHSYNMPTEKNYRFNTPVVLNGPTNYYMRDPVENKPPQNYQYPSGQAKYYNNQNRWTTPRSDMVQGQPPNNMYRENKGRPVNKPKHQQSSSVNLTTQKPKQSDVDDYDDYVPIDEEYLTGKPSEVDEPDDEIENESDNRILSSVKKEDSFEQENNNPTEGEISDPVTMRDIHDQSHETEQTTTESVLSVDKEKASHEEITEANEKTMPRKRVTKLKNSHHIKARDVNSEQRHIENDNVVSRSSYMLPSVTNELNNFMPNMNARAPDSRLRNNFDTSYGFDPNVPGVFTRDGSELTFENNDHGLFNDDEHSLSGTGGFSPNFNAQAPNTRLRNTFDKSDDHGSLNNDVFLSRSADKFLPENHENQRPHEIYNYIIQSKKVKDLDLENDINHRNMYASMESKKHSPHDIEEVGWSRSPGSHSGKHVSFHQGSESLANDILEERTKQSKIIQIQRAHDKDKQNTESKIHHVTNLPHSFIAQQSKQNNNDEGTDDQRAPPQRFLKPYLDNHLTGHKLSYADKHDQQFRSSDSENHQENDHSRDSDDENIESRFSPEPDMDSLNALSRRQLHHKHSSFQPRNGYHEHVKRETSEEKTHSENAESRYALPYLRDRLLPYLRRPDLPYRYSRDPRIPYLYGNEDDYRLPYDRENNIINRILARDGNTEKESRASHGHDILSKDRLPIPHNNIQYKDGNSDNIEPASNHEQTLESAQNGYNYEPNHEENVESRHVLPYGHRKHSSPIAHAPRSYLSHESKPSHAHNVYSHNLKYDNDKIDESRRNQGHNAKSDADLFAIEYTDRLNKMAQKNEDYFDHRTHPNQNHHSQNSPHKTVGQILNLPAKGHSNQLTYRANAENIKEQPKIAPPRGIKDVPKNTRRFNFPLGNMKDFAKAGFKFEFESHGSFKSLDLSSVNTINELQNICLSLEFVKLVCSAMSDSTSPVEIKVLKDKLNTILGVDNRPWQRENKNFQNPNIPSSSHALRYPSTNDLKIPHKNSLLQDIYPIPEFDSTHPQDQLPYKKLDQIIPSRFDGFSLNPQQSFTDHTRKPSEPIHSPAENDFSNLPYFILDDGLPLDSYRKPNVPQNNIKDFEHAYPIPKAAHSLPANGYLVPSDVKHNSDKMVPQSTDSVRPNEMPDPFPYFILPENGNHSSVASIAPLESDFVPNHVPSNHNRVSSFGIDLPNGPLSYKNHTKDNPIVNAYDFPRRQNEQVPTPRKPDDFKPEDQYKWPSLTDLYLPSQQVGKKFYSQNGTWPKYVYEVQKSPDSEVKSAGYAPFSLQPSEKLQPYDNDGQHIPKHPHRPNQPHPGPINEPHKPHDLRPHVDMKKHDEEFQFGQNAQPQHIGNMPFNVYDQGVPQSYSQNLPENILPHHLGPNKLHVESNLKPQSDDYYPGQPQNSHTSPYHGHTITSVNEDANLRPKTFYPVPDENRTSSPIVPLDELRDEQRDNFRPIEEETPFRYDSISRPNKTDGHLQSSHFIPSLNSPQSRPVPNHQWPENDQNPPRRPQEHHQTLPYDHQKPKSGHLPDISNRPRPAYDDSPISPHDYNTPIAQTRPHQMHRPTGDPDLINQPYYDKIGPNSHIKQYGHDKPEGPKDLSPYDIPYDHRPQSQEDHIPRIPDSPRHHLGFPKDLSLPRDHTHTLPYPSHVQKSPDYFGTRVNSVTTTENYRETHHKTGLHPSSQSLSPYKKPDDAYLGEMYGLENQDQNFPVDQNYQPVINIPRPDSDLLKRIINDYNKPAKEYEQPMLKEPLNTNCYHMYITHQKLPPECFVTRPIPGHDFAINHHGTTETNQHRPPAHETNHPQRPHDISQINYEAPLKTNVPSAPNKFLQDRKEINEIKPSDLSLPVTPVKANVSFVITGEQNKNTLPNNPQHTLPDNLRKIPFSTFPEKSRKDFPYFPHGIIPGDSSNVPFLPYRKENDEQFPYFPHAILPSVSNNAQFSPNDIKHGENTPKFPHNILPGGSALRPVSSFPEENTNYASYYPDGTPIKPSDGPYFNNPDEHGKKTLPFPHGNQPSNIESPFLPNRKDGENLPFSSHTVIPSGSDNLPFIMRPEFNVEKVPISPNIIENHGPKTNFLPYEPNYKDKQAIVTYDQQIEQGKTAMSSPPFQQALVKFNQDLENLKKNIGKEETSPIIRAFVYMVEKDGTVPKDGQLPLIYDQNVPSRVRNDVPQYGHIYDLSSLLPSNKAIPLVYESLPQLMNDILPPKKSYLSPNLHKWLAQIPFYRDNFVPIFVCDCKDEIKNGHKNLEDYNVMLTSTRSQSKPVKSKNIEEKIKDRVNIQDSEDEIEYQMIRNKLSDIDNENKEIPKANQNIELSNFTPVSDKIDALFNRRKMTEIENDGQDSFYNNEKVEQSHSAPISDDLPIEKENAKSGEEIITISDELSVDQDKPETNLSDEPKAFSGLPDESVTTLYKNNLNDNFDTPTPLVNVQLETKSVKNDDESDSESENTSTADARKKSKGTLAEQHRDSLNIPSPYEVSPGTVSTATRRSYVSHGSYPQKLFHNYSPNRYEPYSDAATDSFEYATARRLNARLDKSKVKETVKENTENITESMLSSTEKPSDVTEDNVDTTTEKMNSTVVYSDILKTRSGTDSSEVSSSDINNKSQYYSEEFSEESGQKSDDASVESGDVNENFKSLKDSKNEESDEVREDENVKVPEKKIDENTEMTTHPVDDRPENFVTQEALSDDEKLVRDFAKGSEKKTLTETENYDEIVSDYDKNVTPEMSASKQVTSEDEADSIESEMRMLNSKKLGTTEPKDSSLT